MEYTFGSWDFNMLPNPASEGWTNVIYEAHNYAWGGLILPRLRPSAGIVGDFETHYSYDCPFWVGEFNDFQYATAWDRRFSNINRPM